MHDACWRCANNQFKGGQCLWRLTMTALDYKAQEDTRLFEFSGDCQFAIEGESIDISRESNGDMALEFSIRCLAIKWRIPVLASAVAKAVLVTWILQGLLASLIKGGRYPV